MVRIINCFLFDGLSDLEIQNVCKNFGVIKHYNKGYQLYQNGSLGIIIDGNATIRRCNDIGDSITIRTITSGDVFGAASVFGSWQDGMSSVMAITNCNILYISEEDFCKVLERHPQISLNYIRYLSDRIRFLNRKLDAFAAKSTEERLYEFLLSQSSPSAEVTLGFGMSELARRLNVGRTSIYRDIESLQSKKLISRNGHNFKILK